MAASKCARPKTSGAGVAANRRVRDQCRRHAVGNHRRKIRVAAAPGDQQAPAWRGIRSRSSSILAELTTKFAGMPEVSAGEFLLRKFDKFYKYRQELAKSA